MAIDNSTSRASRMRRSKGPLGWGSALAAFALLCGLLLLLARDSPEEQKQLAPTAADQVTQALEEAKNANTALASQNYGEVSAALKKIEATLQQTLKTLRPPVEAEGSPAEQPR